MLNKHEITRFQFLRTKYTLASINIQAAKESSSSAQINCYYALTHLAQVPDLDVNLSQWDSLQYGDYSDVDKAIAYAEERCNILKAQINL